MVQVVGLVLGAMLGLGVGSSGCCMLGCGGVSVAQWGWGDLWVWVVCRAVVLLPLVLLVLWVCVVGKRVRRAVLVARRVALRVERVRRRSMLGLEVGSKSGWRESVMKAACAVWALRMRSWVERAMVRCC